MGPERARMDFEMDEFTPARVAEIEARVNDELVLDRDVRVSHVAETEALEVAVGCVDPVVVRGVLESWPGPARASATCGCRKVRSSP